MVAAGGLPGKKASGRKKVQAGEGGEVRRTGGRAGATQKRQGETADEDSGVETTTLYPCEMPTPGPSSLPANGPTIIVTMPAPTSTASGLVPPP
jgi:hypothetical protein